jgi:hypothetical protein
MPWPQTVDYNSAIQNPRHCFADPDLAGGRPAEGMIPGIPLSYAGSFATVYKVLGADDQPWAVKCFTRRVSNLHLRYKAISEHLRQQKRRFTVDFQYLEEGIKVESGWFPVVKMQWVEGFTFNEFLRDRVGNAGLLEQLCGLWLRLGNDMREARMAHGDLQHGNVMLVRGATPGSLLLRLVDYDGMWVPALENVPPNEVGHPNYQHPQRLTEGCYSAQIDRFSLLAVYTALRCLMVGGKALWSAHDNQENILFREADFKAPWQSRLFPKLLSLPDVAAASLAGHLLLASRGPLDRVPLVADLVAGGASLTAEQLDHLAALGQPVAALTSGPATAAQVPVSVPPQATDPPPAHAPTEWGHQEKAPAGDQPTLLDQPTLAEQPAVAEQPTVMELQTIPDVLGVPPEQRRAAAELFAHANEVLGRTGDHAYALQLLLGSCKLDPANLEHRKKLREVGRALGEGGKRRGFFESLSNLPARSRMRAARGAGEHRKVLEHGEELLAKAPGDVAAQLEMAEAAEALRMPALAVWLLIEARKQAPTDVAALRALARLCERLERFAVAAAVWRQVHQAVPSDQEAADKVKDLAAWEAVVRTATLV